MRQRDILEKYKSIIDIIIKISGMFPNVFYRKTFKFIRNIDSKIAIFVRYICLKNLCQECGDNVAILSGVYMFNIDKLKIGSNVSIHPMCYIDATGGINIEDDVSIAHSTTIMSTEHIHKDVDVNIKDQGCEGKYTTIKKNVWIGSGCRILAGATIEMGAIVAAGSVVKGNIREFVIVGGIPAKIIKERV